ncbi:transmembrane protease serine 11D [Molossus molossus]|uniref:Transmembrane protease serine n=1 Tax=Molossus molossus TaxID=27622 RepID=A0A7J8K2Z8_MOLMO|nr:transmembrane protease serine 11D [Molossus molossus]KAF6503121.1 transmembrane serine protease 11D [Molossus molossus]
MYRPPRVPSTSRFLNPYVVFFIVVAGVLILAATTALLIHFLAFDKKFYFYYSSFQIPNEKYSDQLNSQATQAYRILSGRVESVITTTFKESSLRNQFIRARVVKLRRNGDAVIADTVMKFKFSRNNNAASMKSRIESVLHHIPNKFGNMEINPSDEIIEITNQDTEIMLTQECGAHPNLITLSEERVMGGTRAEEGDWPWQVSLQLNNIHHCGGVLISNTWILTAAHCFRSHPHPREWTATFGISLAFPVQRKRIQTILMHNNYNFVTHENDIAAVKLNSNVTWTKNIHKVCLPEATQHVVPGSVAYVTGWGSQVYGGNTVRDLQQGRVYIISNNVCNAPAGYNGLVSSGMLCAGVPQGGVDACQGDSGGPLVQQDTRRLWFLVGIVSWGDKCGLSDKPGVYTRVTAYRDWITEQTGI